MEEIDSTLDEICRTCGDNISKTLSSFFKEEKMILIQFIHNKEYSIKIAKNDGLPQNICCECENQFLKINFFLKKCEETQKILLKKFNTAIKQAPLDEFKIEYVSDNDETNYNKSDTPEGCSENVKVKIEKINPLKLELKIEKETTEIYAEKLFLTKSSRSKDKNALKNKNEASCDIVSTKQKARSNAKKKSDNQNNQFTCSVCNEEFNNMIELKEHKKVHPKLKKATRQIFLCDHCGKEFVKQNSLNDHTNIHLGLKPYKCELCERSFAVKNAYRTHMAKHLHNKTYKCEVCEKEFTTQAYYREHSKRHEKGILLKNSERQFKCPLCPKSFKLLSTLTSHCNYHSKTSDRKYQCTECNTTFKRSDHLKEHINGVHLNIKPFKCETCSKSFVTRALRNAHVKKYHSGIRYKCNICEKDFSLSNTLSRHKRIHNGDKRFVCEICNMSFMAVYQIEKHMEIHKIDEETKNSLITQTYEKITKGILDTNQK